MGAKVGDKEEGYGTDRARVEPGVESLEEGPGRRPIVELRKESWRRLDRCTQGD